MPLTYRVIVLPEALDDLDALTAHIKQDSPQNALQQFHRLWNAAQSLATLPHRYKVHRSARDPDRIIRSMPVPPFFVYYRILEAHRTIEILTIRHGHQRQPQRFK